MLQVRLKATVIPLYTRGLAAFLSGMTFSSLGLDPSKSSSPCSSRSYCSKMLINEKSDSPITLPLVVSENFLLIDLDVGILGSKTLFIIFLRFLTVK